MTTRRNEPVKEELHSVSALARMLDLDRATVTRRLDEGDVQPVKSRAKEKLYRLREAIAALTAAGSNELDEARRRKVVLESERLQIQLDRDRSELVSAKEVRDTLQKIFKQMHNRLCVQYPREAAQQLFKAESAGQISDMIGRDIARIFNELRNDHTKFLGDK
ncbi:MAG: DUF1441 family protein [Pyrinomonadaceae bacterium MAG19_C2-C3]|nr:DUF1441 family protein [Pyrinomonadaceae bacterium MAG19_C2-C3]